VVRRVWLLDQDWGVLGVGYVCIGGYWEFRHDYDHFVIDGNLCRNLGLSRGRLSNIYYRCWDLVFREGWVIFIISVDDFGVNVVLSNSCCLHASGLSLSNQRSWKGDPVVAGWVRYIRGVTLPVCPLNPPFLRYNKINLSLSWGWWWFYYIRIKKGERQGKDVTLELRCTVSRWCLFFFIYIFQSPGSRGSRWTVWFHPFTIRTGLEIHQTIDNFKTYNVEHIFLPNPSLQQCYSRRPPKHVSFLYFPVHHQYVHWKLYNIE
jgi:hypothetical protein